MPIGTHQWLHPGRSVPVGAVSLALGLMAFAFCTDCSAAKALDHPQPELGHRSVPLLEVDGRSFKDLNRNGRLDPYEDWRRSPEARARDLVRRMQLDELAGLLFHGNLPVAGPLGPDASGAYDLDKLAVLIGTNHVTSFLTRSNAPPRALAAAHNRFQELAENARLAIPLTISSDPRSHIQSSALTSIRSGSFSTWPEPTGLAAIGDPGLVREFADIVRREYLAVGIREGLSPQADLATEPRWSRLNGTFGEDAQLARSMVQAYVEGFQNGGSGLNSGSVAAIVKHWVGYGAQEEGLDSHSYYGRYATFPGNNFAYHVIPFEGAFAAHAAGVMPTYSILRNLSIGGKPVAPVGVGFNAQLLNGLLRGTYRFGGIVVTDWSITKDCGPECKDGFPEGVTPTFSGLGMPWGVEALSKEDRIAMAIAAGVDQIGGSEETEILMSAIEHHKVSRRRVEESAVRVLMQKFELGLFENPYVDENKAEEIVGNAEFLRRGEEAQSRSLVLLENKDHVLPLSGQGKKVYLYGVDSKSAESFGLIPVERPEAADVAIVRAKAPFEVLHPRFALGRIQHEGRLDFREGDASYDALLAASAHVPTVFVVDMSRPAILTNVRDHAVAVVASFGVGDKALLAMLTGEVPPHAHMPFELPSSMEEVIHQKGDLPHDTAHPLYPYGFGLSY